MLSIGSLHGTTVAKMGQHPWHQKGASSQRFAFLAYGLWLHGLRFWEGHKGAVTAPLCLRAYVPAYLPTYPWCPCRHRGIVAMCNS